MSLWNLSWILNACAFYLCRLWRWQPLAIFALFCSAACLCVSTIFMSYYSERISSAQNDIQNLRRSGPAVLPVVTQAVSAAEDLPVFDSAAFIAQFHATAQEVGLLPDELVYVLESSAAQPFQRYRITTEVKAGYPELRKFIAAVGNAQPNVALDTLRCRREDASAAVLICQLAFSAFFHKPNDA